MTINQEKYLMLLSAMSYAVFRLQEITQLLILAQEEAERMTRKSPLPAEDGEQVLGTE